MAVNGIIHAILASKMKLSKQITWRVTFMVILALIASPRALAKNDRAVCDETLLSQNFAGDEISTAKAMLNSVYREGFGTFRVTSVEATTVDAVIVLILKDEVEFTLEEAVREYALGTLSLSSFCGKPGVIEDGHRLRVARSTVNLLPWVGQTHAKQIIQRIRSILSSQLSEGCG